MQFKEWYRPTEFLEQALGGILAMNLRHRIDEGRKDPERLRNALVSRDGEDEGPKQQNLFGSLQSDDERKAEEEKERRDKFDQSGKRPEWNRCELTPLSSYEREIKGLQVAARSNADTFAQILLFSPLSANVNFAKHWDNIPVVYNLLVTLFPDKIKPVDAGDDKFKNEPAKLLQKWMLPFSEKMYGLGATIGGWKYDTIAYVWNNRQELKRRLESIADSGGGDADLIMAMRDIPGVKPVKAGFIAQLLYGKAGCIDTHNIDIYGRAFPDMKGELNDKLWQKYGKDTPRGNEVTKKTIQSYAGTLDKLKSRGIGTAELWDVWVDFVGRMYKAILPGGLYTNKKGPALNPNDPKYKDIKTTVPKERILASGKKMKGNFVGVDTVSGDESGGGASLTHDLPRHHPHEMLKQLYKADRGDGDAADFTQAIIRQPKMMGPRPAAVHYFHPAVDPETGEVDPERLNDLIRGVGEIGGEKMRNKMQSRSDREKEKRSTLF
jgi:hypothetical protein